MVPERRRYPKTAGVVNEVMIEMSAALSSDQSGAGCADVNAIVHGFVVQKANPDSYQDTCRKCCVPEHEI